MANTIYKSSDMATAIAGGRLIFARLYSWRWMLLLLLLYIKDGVLPLRFSDTAYYDVVTTFDYDTSKTNQAAGSYDYYQLRYDIEETMLARLYQSGLAVLSVEMEILSLEKGSLVANCRIQVLAYNSSDQEEAVTSALLKVMGSGPMVLNNRTTTCTHVNIGGIEFSATDSPCEIRRKRDPCPGRQVCVEEGEEAVCKYNSKTEEKNVFLGLWIGLPLFALLGGVVGVGAYFWVRKQKEHARPKESDLLRLSKERLRSTGNVDNRVSNSGYRKERSSFTNPGQRVSSIYQDGGHSWMDDPLINRHRGATGSELQMDLSGLPVVNHWYNQPRDGLSRPRNTEFSPQQTQSTDFNHQSYPRENFQLRPLNAEVRQQQRGTPEPIHHPWSQGPRQENFQLRPLNAEVRQQQRDTPEPKYHPWLQGSRPVDYPYHYHSAIREPVMQY